MATINDIKELECADTPVLLFRCTLVSGDVQRWSTHNITLDGDAYEARVLQHNAFEIRSSADDSTDGAAKLSLTLANADGYFSSIERTVGWKGAQLTVTFVFYDFGAGAASDSRVVFRGIANAPDESNELGLKLTFTNRLNLTRIYLPETSIQKLCPWSFPATPGERSEALTGAVFGKYSPTYRCGYSADLDEGCGDLDATGPFLTCNGTRADCTRRGMFSSDTRQNTTARFGGIEFVPPSIVVRTYREKGTHVSNALQNQATYSDCVPLIYGTGWHEPLIVFARNDGNLTHMEALLGAGEISSVSKVVVNGIEIPAGVQGANMMATGWYNVVSSGARTGAFNYDFADSNGSAVGDPYGSMAYMSVVVPNAISNGRSLPSIQALIRGLKLPQYDASGALVRETYSNNPVWVLLDVLRRSGWTTADIDFGSFASAAAVCDQPKPTIDPNGNNALAPRFQCNLILTNLRSASDIVRGVRNGSGLYLNYNAQGLLRVTVEDSIAAQQRLKPEGSNAAALLNEGWPAYEFSDGAISGIAVRTNGQSSLRVYSRTTADTPNRLTVEFQDEFNDYQQDSFIISDAQDRTSIRQVVSAPLAALGIPNYDQAARAAYLAICKSVRANTYVEFETSVKAIGLSPGDIISITHAKEGFCRQPFRILSIAPGMNYRRVLITAQLHDDAWYSPQDAIGAGLGHQSVAKVGTPRPLVGAVVDEDGSTQFGIEETTIADTDGGTTVQLTASFNIPAAASNSSVSMPLLSLEPVIASTGGALPAGRMYYYAVTAIDQTGAEGPLSFTVAAATPEGTDTNCITLQNLSFSHNTAAFNVYRGAAPGNLLQVAEHVPVDAQFMDSGLVPTPQGPPDPNFDHANFYWRYVIRPEQKADIYGTNTIGVSTAGMQGNEFRGATVRICGGRGAGQERSVVSNTDSTVMIAPKWDIPPDATSEFLIADSSWRFGATATCAPATFEIPNQAGAVLQISGRAANVHDDECVYDLSPLSTWKIDGGSTSAIDLDVPAQPAFGLSATGQGAVEVVGISFFDLTNTRGITSGTLSVVFWDEIFGPAPIAIGAPLSESDTTITLTGSISMQAGTVIQIESELCLLQQDVTNASSLVVSRGEYGATATAHNAGAFMYPLIERRS